MNRSATSIATAAAAASPNGGGEFECGLRLTLRTPNAGRVAAALREAMLDDATRGFPFVQKLCGLEYGDGGGGSDELFEALALFYMQHGLTRHLVRKVFLRALCDEDESAHGDGGDATATTALRSDTPSSRLLTHVLQAEGGAWLRDQLKDVYAAIREGSAQAGPRRLVELCEQMAVDGAVPAGVARVLQQVSTLAHQHRPAVADLLVANVFVLRFVAPSIVDPNRRAGALSAAPGAPPYTAEQLRLAVSLSKTLRAVTAPAESTTDATSKQLRAAYQAAIQAVCAQSVAELDPAALVEERVAAAMESVRDAIARHVPQLLADSSVATGPVMTQLLSVSLQSLLFATNGIHA